jgi:hypothetical protein
MFLKKNRNSLGSPWRVLSSKGATLATFYWAVPSVTRVPSRPGTCWWCGKVVGLGTTWCVWVFGAGLPHAPSVWAPTQHNQPGALVPVAGRKVPVRALLGARFLACLNAGTLLCLVLACPLPTKFFLLATPFHLGARCLGAPCLGSWCLSACSLGARFFTPP